MKQTKRSLILVSVLIISCLLGGIAAFSMGYVPNGLQLLVIVLIIIAAIYAFVTHLRQHREVQSGFPAEDEMSTRIKHKAGYYAFLASIYMWLFIFLFKDFFSDVETMLGGGILVSATLSIVIKAYVTRTYHEDQN